MRLSLSYTLGCRYEYLCGKHIAEYCLSICVSVLRKRFRLEPLNNYLKAAVFPEFVIAAVTSSVLGWGAMTWKKSEQAKDVAEKAMHKIDAIELKVAEDYITKRDFQQSMDRLFDTLSEMKADVKYLSERVDYHVNDQAGEVRDLKEQLNKAKKRNWF